MVKKWLFLAVLALMVMAVACAPKSAPTPVPTSVATPAPTTLAPKPQSTQTAPTPSTSSPSPEDAAWARVIEAGKKEGSITVYNITFTGDLGNAVSKAFLEKYGISVNFIYGPAAPFEERVKTEERMGNVTADVAESSVDAGIDLRREGFLVPLGKELPVLREDAWLIPPAMDEAGNILRGYIYYMTPWMNTDMVKAEETPKTWNDLLDPRWKGKLLNIDPRTTSFADRYVYNLLNNKIVDPDYFTKLAAQKLIIPSGVGPGAPYPSLAKGEGAIVVMGVDVYAERFVSQGAHIKPVVLSGIVPLTPSFFFSLTHAPHPNAAKLFTNFVLSRQGWELVTTMNNAGSLRKDVADRSRLASLKPFKIIDNSLDEDIQLAQNYANRVAAKALGVQ